MSAGKMGFPEASQTLQKDEPLQRSLRGVFQFAGDATKVQEVVEGDQVLHVVQAGVLVFWEYSGLGGVVFDFNGLLIDVPAASTATTVRGFRMVGV